MEQNKLLMSFVDESPNYVHGFECGQIWEQMKRNMRFADYLIHTANIRQIEMMCKRFHYSYNIEKIDETWSVLFAQVSEKVN